MKKYLGLLFIWLAADAQVQNFDRNGDGRPDLVLHFKNGRLQQKLLDTNYDGRYELKESLGKNELERQVDRNNDGFHESALKLQSFGAKAKLSRYAKDKKGNLKLLTTEDISVVDNQSANCVGLRENTLTYFEAFARSFDQVLAGGEQDLFPIAPGVRGHKSCDKSFKREFFTEMAQASVKRGLACLSKVARQKKDAKRRIEVFNLLDMFKAHFEDGLANVDIACGDKSVDWRDTRAVGSSLPVEKYGEHELDHPFVILNPKVESGFWGGIKDFNGSMEEEEFQALIFHEMIHNMGYRHGDGLDLSYGCETCCFSGDELVDGELDLGKSAACRICAGDYSDETDPAYMRDLAQYEKNIETYAFLSLIIKRKKDIEWNDEALSSIVDYFSGVDPDFAKELHAALKDKFSSPAASLEWEKKLESDGAYVDEVQEFYSAAADFVTALIVEGDENRAAEKFTKVDYPLMLSMASSGGTMAMGRQQSARKSLKLLQNLAVALRGNMRGRMLNMRVNVFLSHLRGR